MHRGRCEDCQPKGWKNRSPSSIALAGNAEHRAQRRRARRRARDRCEGCGARGVPLSLHHPKPISKGGKIVQADAELLCDPCHRDADRVAGVRN